MATSSGYFDFVLGQLSEVADISSRKMMGEYVIYCKGKVFGGIYDDRFLVKNVPSAVAYVGEDAKFEIPYEGAKKMILVEELDDKEYLKGLIEGMVEELPETKKKKKKE